MIPKARGTAARLKEEAEGYGQRVVAQAEGDAQRFRSVLAEYQKAPAVTRDRLYIDTMQQVYSNVSKVMVESRSGSNARRFLADYGGALVVDDYAGYKSLFQSTPMRELGSLVQDRQSTIMADTRLKIVLITSCCSHYGRERIPRSRTVRPTPRRRGCRRRRWNLAGG